jgi:hypothetical protein
MREMTLVEKVEKIVSSNPDLSSWEHDFINDVSDLDSDEQFTILQEDKVNELYERHCL